MQYSYDDNNILSSVIYGNRVNQICSLNVYYTVINYIVVNVYFIKKKKINKYKITSVYIFQTVIVSLEKRIKVQQRWDIIFKIFIIAMQFKM